MGLPICLASPALYGDSREAPVPWVSRDQACKEPRGLLENPHPLLGWVLNVIL